MRTQLFSVTRTVVLSGLVTLAGAVAFADTEATPTPGPTPTGKQTLDEVAKGKKLNKDAVGESGGPIVITNDNLDDYASKGELTQIEGSVKGASEGPRARPVTIVDSEAQEEQQKKYKWQQRYKQQAGKIASLKGQIAQLDIEIPGLWNDFYSRDDPAYRDGVIKPKLDYSLRRREELEKQLAIEEPKLEQIKIDARRDGAPPGWLREMQSAPARRPQK